MFWVAVLLALIIWILGLASGFLGIFIHLFLIIAMLAALAAALPNSANDADTPDTTAPTITEDNANFVPTAVENSVDHEDPVEQG